MALTKTFDQLREHVDFIASSDAATGMINTTSAEIRYIFPVLGATLYDELNNQVESDNVPDANKMLLTLCRAVACPMAVYHKLGTTQTKLTDTGLKTSSTENFEAAHRWEYMEVKEQLIDQASLALDALITYLVENADTFTWVNAKYKGLIKTGAEFNEYFTLYQPHRTFQQLLPMVREAESYVADAIGSDFLDDLKELTEPSNAEQHVIDLCKKFIVNYAINRSQGKLSVQVTPQGFTVTLTATDKPNDGMANAPDNLLSMLYTTTKEDAKRYMGKLKSYLNLKASASVFITYFGSSYYINPSLPLARVRNSCRKGVFGM